MNQPHCNTHARFEYDCMDCHDELLGCTARFPPPNITCTTCKHRHPATVSCDQARRQAELNRLKRTEVHTHRVSEEYTQALDDYKLAIEQVNSLLGEGAPMSIIALIDAWKKLGEANGR